MSDTDGKKPLGLSGGARSGRVNQSFSRGRTKSVVVETKRKRVMVPKPGAQSAAAQNAEGGKRDKSVPDAELERRLKALAGRQGPRSRGRERRASEEKEREEERARRRAEAEAKEREERSVKKRSRPRKKKTHAARPRKRHAATRRCPRRPVARPRTRRRQTGARYLASPPHRRREPQGRRRPWRPWPWRRRRGERRSGKLTVNQALAGGEGGRQRSSPR
jgi:translation initiation factor IF-2